MAHKSAGSHSQLRFGARCLQAGIYQASPLYSASDLQGALRLLTCSLPIRQQACRSLTGQGAGVSRGQIVRRIRHPMARASSENSQVAQANGGLDRDVFLRTPPHLDTGLVADAAQRHPGSSLCGEPCRAGAPNRYSLASRLLFRWPEPRSRCEASPFTSASCSLSIASTGENMAASTGRISPSPKPLKAVTRWGPSTSRPRGAPPAAGFYPEAALSLLVC